jgi:cytochrome b561
MATAGRKPGLLARWPPSLRVLHWAMAALLPVQAALGWYGDRSADPKQAMQLLGWHHGLGMMLLALLGLRIGVRLAAPRRAPVPGARAGRIAAGCAQLALYALLLALPASGYVIWVWMDAPMDVFGLIDLPRLFEPPADDERGRALAWYVHVWGAWSLAALVSLHIAAAAWHRLRPAGLPHARAVN